MSDTEREALKPCPFCGNTRPMVLARTCERRTPYDARDRAFPVVRCRCSASVDGENWGAEQTAIEAWNRRSTTTEARAPLSDEQIEANAVFYGTFYQGNPTGEWAFSPDRLCDFVQDIAARAPAPPSVPPNLYVPGEQYCDGLGLCIKNTVRAGPPAPSVPSVSVDETEAKASAVQRPAGGDGAP